MSLNPSPAASRRPLPPAGEVSTRDLWVMIRPRDVGNLGLPCDMERIRFFCSFYELYRCKNEILQPKK
jgi:hypothetical protein